MLPYSLNTNSYVISVLLKFKTLIKTTIILLIIYPQPINYILDLSYLLPVNLFGVCGGQGPWGNFGAYVIIIFITLVLNFNKSYFSVLLSPTEILLVTTFNLSAYTSSYFTTLSSFFRQNELLFQDGFYIDFLQKQTLEM